MTGRPRRILLALRRPSSSSSSSSLSSSSSDAEVGPPAAGTTTDSTVLPPSPSVLSKEAATSPRDYDPANRYLAALPPAIAVHLSIGPVYAYSMWTPGMSRALGVVSPAPGDWSSHADLLPVFSASAVALGLTTSVVGGWVERVGPRTAGAVGSALWCGALLTSAAGVETHSLPLVY
jgi:hypothetical protein